MRRLMLPTVLFAISAVVTACGYGPGYGNSDQPMMTTGAPCSYRAVDSGACPKVGYKLPSGAHY